MEIYYDKIPKNISRIQNSKISAMLDIPFFIKVNFVIIALLGRMDQCCSKLKISGAGPGKKYFEPALQQYQYSGTTSGKPRYTIQTGTKRCDLVNVREQYQSPNPGKYCNWMIIDKFLCTYLRDILHIPLMLY